MSEEPRPYTLVAELTYRCPLRCAYCSNPTDWARHADALTTDDWLRVFREAEALGVVQLNLTGGEPLLRDDLEPLVEGARRLDLYTNLITSGIPLTRARLGRVLGGEAVDDGADGVLARAQLHHVGGGGIEHEPALRIEQQVARRLPVPAEPRLGRQRRAALRRDRAHARAPPGPQPGSTYAVYRESSRCHRISVLRISAATHRSCSS